MSVGMLRHLNDRPTQPTRVLVIGAGGFVGKAIADRIARDGTLVRRLGRREIDLLAPDGAERLAGELREGDAVVAVAAIAPCKTPEMLKDNVVLATTLVRAIARVPVAHVVNVSSDAVFADEPVPLHEASPRMPCSYHGIMHLAREIMFETEIKAPVAVLRPTLIYGADDPHNGYGPNSFRRKANRGETIALFGEGEEQRDHVCIDDVAELAARVISRRSIGSLNVATGSVTSFRAVAEAAVRLSGKPAPITGTPRKGPMPHNGYRPFDPSATAAAFSDFRYVALTDGMARAQQAEFPRG
jgi:UDP-glucose 4-epimerase